MDWVRAGLGANWLERLYWCFVFPRLTLRNAIDRWHDRLRQKVPEPRVWIWTWVGGREFWMEMTCPNEADRVLVAVGMAASRNEAQRIIKQSGPRYRSWVPETWTRIPRFDFKFPTGCPVILRRSGDTYITKTVMIPNASSWLRFWNRRTWRDEPDDGAI